MAKGYKKYETKIIRPEEVRPGEKISGILELGESGFSVPATILCGKAPGKTVLITAGVHAGEYVGIQAVLCWNWRRNFCRSRSAAGSCW